MPPLILFALACDLCAMGLMLYAACRTEVEPMARKPVTRDNLLAAETLLESALATVRVALKLSDPEPAQKHDRDAADLAADLALDAGGLLKGV
jgi:hypothetical protein